MKIVIIGYSGSGKLALARKLGVILCLAVDKKGNCRYTGNREG